jgi:uncharacterized protein YndB with AHSA1/START domain
MANTKTTQTSKPAAKTAPAAPPPLGDKPQTVKVGATTAKTEPQPDGTLTLRLTRVIKAPADRIYQCFLDPDALAKWIPPHGFVGHVDKLEPKVGGRYHMSFATINKSWTQSFGGVYKELIPGKRIVHTDKFDDPNAKGELLVTIDLVPVKGGTEVRIEQRGIPKGPMSDGAPYGWSQSLDNLATMCEIELPF